MEKKDWIKLVMLLSFAFLLLGGLNWLFVGLFQIDLIALLFGGAARAVSRIFYVLFGLSAIALLTMVILKSNADKKSAGAAAGK